MFKESSKVTINGYTLRRTVAEDCEAYDVVKDGECVGIVNVKGHIIRASCRKNLSSWEVYLDITEGRHALEDDECSYHLKRAVNAIHFKLTGGNGCQFRSSPLPRRPETNSRDADDLAWHNERMCAAIDQLPDLHKEDITADTMPSMELVKLIRACKVARQEVADKDKAPFPKTLAGLRKRCKEHGITVKKSTMSWGPHVSFEIGGISTGSVIPGAHYKAHKASFDALREIEQEFAGLEIDGIRVYGLHRGQSILRGHLNYGPRYQQCGDR